MKKRLFLLLLGCATMLGAQAQLNGAGYYRVKNVSTGRYMSLSDNHSRGVNFASTSADCGAMATSSIWEDISHDPGSVFYLDHISGESYNVVGQGTSLYGIIQYYIYLTPVGKYYKAWQQDSGQRITLTDKKSSKAVSYVTTTGTYSTWNITPINTSDNYIGVKPTVTVGDKHYAAVFAGYPYTLGAGMKAYYVTKVIEKEGVIIIKELTGTIPAKTPVLIECASTDVSKNQVTPVVSDAAVPSDLAAQVKGVYFCIGNPWSGHFNSVKFDASSMRAFSANSYGYIAMTTSKDALTSVNIDQEDSNGDNLSVLAIPANSWYLSVSSSAPSEMKMVTAEQYATGIKDITVKPASLYNVYTLEGVQIKKNATSISDLHQGIYIINGKKVVIK